MMFQWSCRRSHTEGWRAKNFISSATKACANCEASVARNVCVCCCSIHTNPKLVSSVCVCPLSLEQLHKLLTYRRCFTPNGFIYTALLIATGSSEISWLHYWAEAWLAAPNLTIRGVLLHAHKSSLNHSRLQEHQILSHTDQSVHVVTVRFVSCHCYSSRLCKYSLCVQMKPIKLFWAPDLIINVEAAAVLLWEIIMTGNKQLLLLQILILEFRSVAHWSCIN